jgi:DNA polymerase phi
LEAKESLSGQAAMFDHNDDEDDNGDDEDDPDGASDVEDVEMADIDSAESGSENAVNGGTDDTSDSKYASESPDDELAAFNAKLKRAVRARPGTHSSDAEESSSSDEDMNDEQMEAVDHHLEKVFRERQKLSGKKNEKKDAKENIINFKCRVLELLEIYVKQQHAKILALSLLLPILAVIRTTTSPLVSSKACNLVREYTRLCKGNGLPDVTHHDSVFEKLEKIHDEAGKEASNAHGNACSQASLLLVRVLVAQDRELLRRVVKVYARTQENTLFDSSCKVKTKFFTDWLNWCTSAQK